MRYALPTMLGIAVLAAATGASAQELPEGIRKAGKIVVATMPNYPPVTYKDPATGKLTGVDIDLGEAIAAELGVKLEWQEIAFAQMLPSLQTGRADTALAGMSDTKERQETVDFVDYMRSGTQFYTTSKLADTIRAPRDLCGKKVGASRSTNNLQRVAEWSKSNCEASGAPAIIGVGTEGSADARTQLKTGRIDAAVQGNETLPYFQQQEPNTYVLLGEPLTEEITGMPFVKSQSQLRDAVKGALDRLMRNGTYAKILGKYGLNQNSLPEARINSVK